MIELSSVSFSYDSKNIFNNISYKFSSPGKYLILGDNAAGKSTFLNLLCGFIKLKLGDIFIDNISINKPFSNLDRFRSLIAYLPENIKFSNNFRVCEILRFYELNKNKVFELLGINENLKFNSLSEAYKYRLLIFLVLKYKKYLLIDDLLKFQDQNNNIAKIINEYCFGQTLIVTAPSIINNISWDKVLKIKENKLIDA